MLILKRDIRLNTFFKKGLPRIDDRFGVYFCTGRQGSGKSYYAIYLALQQLGYNFKTKKTTENFKVITNIHSLRIEGVPVRYFSKITEIYTDTTQYCIFIIDEIARKYDKNSKTDTQFYAFLNQCRKMHRVCILITQEWKELPMWIRRPAKFCITSVPTLLNRVNIYKTIVGDAENMVLDKDSMEWNCPPLRYIYYKRIQQSSADLQIKLFHYRPKPASHHCTSILNRRNKGCFYFCPIC